MIKYQDKGEEISTITKVILRDNKHKLFNVSKSKFPNTSELNFNKILVPIEPLELLQQGIASVLTHSSAKPPQQSVIIKTH